MDRKKVTKSQRKTSTDFSVLIANELMLTSITLKWSGSYQSKLNCSSNYLQQITFFSTDIILYKLDKFINNKREWFTWCYELNTTYLNNLNGVYSNVISHERNIKLVELYILFFFSCLTYIVQIILFIMKIHSHLTEIAYVTTIKYTLGKERDEK
jgi:hypothetical protein